MAEKREITTADGARLAARLFRPDGAPKAVIVLHGAVGVPQRFYRHFAAWLAGQGYACLTYDYRDFGASGTGRMKGSTATLAQWGLQDQSAARDAAKAFYSDAPLWVIGHSLGGFMVPLQQDSNRIDRLISVASGAIQVGDHPWPYRAAVYAFWYGPAVPVNAVLGYLPARRMMMGPDLPGGVYSQWRRWCTGKQFYRCDMGKSLPESLPPPYTGPLKMIAFADDKMMPPKAVWRLKQYYTDAQITPITLDPRQFGLSKVGHLGVFRPENAALWPEIIA